MDELYFESGYLEASYFVYVANATAGFTPYIAEGYLPADFFEDRGSFAAIFCDAEIVVGMLLEAQAFLSGTFSINAGVQRFLTTSIALTSSFTQTAIGTRGKDTDLFAFSDAAISVQVSRIRGTNITASSVFSVAVDFVVKRNADADVDAIFSAIINGLRSRDTNLQTQAAFSFDVAVNVIKGVNSNITVQSTVSIVAERLRGINSSQNSEFAQTTSGDRIRFGTVALSTASTVTATARKIRDAHLTGTGVAAITCIPNFTTNGSALIQSVGTVFFIGGLRKTFNAAISCHSSILVSKYFGSHRPTNIVEGTPVYDSGEKKFGTHSLSGSSEIRNGLFSSSAPSYRPQPPQVNQDWVVEAWIYKSSLTAGTSISGNVWIQLGVSSGNALFVTLKSSNYTNRVLINVGTGIPLTTNAWNHIAIVKNSSRISVYRNGTRIGTSTTLPTSYFYSQPDTIANAYFGFEASTPTANRNRLDEFSIHVGTTLGYDPDNSSISVPTEARVNDPVYTRLLHHFDNNGLDDISVTADAAAALQSQATVSAAVGYIVISQAAISASSSVVALVGKLKEINLVAFDDAELSATATRIKSLSSSITSNSSVSITADRFRDVISTQVSQASVSVDAYRIKQFNSDLTTSAATLTLATEFQGIVANLSSRFFTARIYLDDDYITSGYYEQVETNAVKTARGNASLQVTATLSASIRTDVLAALITTSQASVTATVVKTVSVNIAQAAAFSQNAVVRKTARGIASATGVFTVFCNAVTAGEINLVAFSTASVSVTATANKSFSSALSSVSTVFAYTQDSLNSVGEAHISSQCSTTIVAVKRVNAVIVTQAIASSLSVVVKAVAVQIPLDCNFTQSATAFRIKQISSTQSALATISTTPFKTVTTQSTITAQSTVAASGTKVVSAVIVTEAVASTLTANIRIAGLFIECSVVTTVSASGVANKSAGATISSTATFTSATVKLVNASAAIVSSGSLSATVGLRKQFTAAFTSALTFVVAIRDLRLDEIVYVIPGENYVYKIISESRLSDIYGETRIRSVTGESRIRTITGESRIHIN